MSNNSIVTPNPRVDCSISVTPSVSSSTYPSKPQTFGEFLEKLDHEAPPGAFSTFDMEVLVPEVEKLEKGEVYLEIGVDKGKSLFVARQSNSEIAVFGVDLKDNPQIPGTTFFKADSVEVAKEYTEPKISVLHIDGDHSYEGCKRDIEAWHPHMKDGGVMLFHDCDESSPGVLWAVSEFVYTHGVPKFELFKRVDKNTSMAKVQL